MKHLAPIKGLVNTAASKSLLASSRDRSRPGCIEPRCRLKGVANPNQSRVVFAPRCSWWKGFGSRNWQCGMFA